jgi:hypothetical protein
MHVRFDDELDAQAGFRGLLQVVVHVPLRIHDHRTAGRLVADQVGRMREAVEVVLREVHGPRPPRPYPNSGSILGP